MDGGGREFQSMIVDRLSPLISPTVADWAPTFGESASSGSGASANGAVPEPTTAVMLMFAAAGLCIRPGRAA
jgi:hypothetical protein